MDDEVALQAGSSVFLPACPFVQGQSFLSLPIGLGRNPAQGGPADILEPV